CDRTPDDCTDRTHDLLGAGGRPLHLRAGRAGGEDQGRARSSSSTTRCSGSWSEATATFSCCCARTAARLDALANALLDDETLDEDQAYAAAGIPEPGSAPGELAAAAFSASPPAA